MDDLITPEAMRAAMRTQIEAGVDRQSISVLVCAFAQPDGSDKPRTQGRVPRIVVERIPEWKRAAFLAELNQLQPSEFGTEWLSGLAVLVRQTARVI